MEPVEGQGSPSKVLDRLFKTTKTSTIPHLTELRKALGYGNPGQEQDIAFKRAIRAQIESFVSPSTKIPAYKLTKWRLPLHQRGLQEVTKDFLDTKGKGSEFWPARHDSINTRCLEYSKDSSRIRRLMIKVFWRAAREYKRNKPSNSTTTKQPSQLSDRDALPLKPLDTPTDDKRQVLDNNSHILKGQSIDNPIDVESMQSRTNTSGLSTDDHFAGLGFAFNFILGAQQRQDTPDESSSSEPFSSLQLVPDTVGTMMPIPEEAESASRTDLYEVPPSPPGVTETSNGKRPVEPDSDDLNRQAKVPRQDPNTSAKSTRQRPKGTRGARKTQSPRPRVRSSQRKSKPPYRPGAATEEQIQAFVNSTPTSSPPPAVVEPSRRSNEGQSEQPSATTNDSTSKTSAGETQGQSQTEAIRAELARQAERQTTEAAIAAGADQQLDAHCTSTNGLSAKAQGKLPEVQAKQTPTVQAGPSREREAESTARPEASAARQQGSLSGNLESEDPQRQVLNGREIVIVIRSDIANGVDFMSWKPSSFLFNMSLADVAEELGLRHGRTLHMSLRGRMSNLCEEFEPGDEDGFESFKDECLGVIMQRHSGTASTPVLQRQQFRIYFSDKPISI
ncbi:hypothetical protein FMUND_3842 [Fusarium mundagurra]|uniref:Uncharacterized protein n=1 Tax=Fusarium mundagurra TaxID=1567541 RepID=A0A8H6DLB2_9HYPO|nr:hypothetical protein FMUND_3842 [Fusarium mundagurra]